MAAMEPENENASTKKKNKESKLLSQKENDLTFRLLEPGCYAMATTVSSLFFKDDILNVWKRQAVGVLCFVRDTILSVSYLRIYSLQQYLAVFEVKVTREVFKFTAPNNESIRFQHNGTWAMFTFGESKCAKSEAKEVIEIVKERSRKKMRHMFTKKLIGLGKKKESESTNVRSMKQWDSKSVDYSQDPAVRQLFKKLGPEYEVLLSSEKCRRLLYHTIVELGGIEKVREAAKKAEAEQGKQQGKQPGKQPSKAPPPLPPREASKAGKSPMTLAPPARKEAKTPPPVPPRRGASKTPLSPSKSTSKTPPPRPPPPSTTPSSKTPPPRPPPPQTSETQPAAPASPPQPPPASPGQAGIPSAPPAPPPPPPESSGIPPAPPPPPPPGTSTIPPVPPPPPPAGTTKAPAAPPPPSSPTAPGAAAVTKSSGAKSTLPPARQNLMDEIKARRQQMDGRIAATYAGAGPQIGSSKKPVNATEKDKSKSRETTSEDESATLAAAAAGLPPPPPPGDPLRDLRAASKDSKRPPPEPPDMLTQIRQAAERIRQATAAKDDDSSDSDKTNDRDEWVD